MSRGEETGDKREAAPDRRLRRTRRFGFLLNHLLSPSARARGFAEASLLTEWSTIVGPVLAKRCQPVAVRFPRGRYRGGILELRAGGSAALELQHSAPQIIERINVYFGFPAVRQLKLVQAPIHRRAERSVVRRSLTPAEELSLVADVSDVKEADLREALLALGRALRSARS